LFHIIQNNSFAKNVNPKSRKDRGRITGEIKRRIEESALYTPDMILDIAHAILISDIQ
jgi:hypothetical protein